MSAETDAAQRLLSAHMVRARAQQMLALARADRLHHWRLDETHMEATADFVLAVMRRNYSMLDIPFHARWRHFTVGGDDLWTRLAGATHWPDAAAKARARFDLAIVSVLLDAGAGAHWRYRHGDATLSRSEGLAVASLDMFAGGLFSSDARQPLRADAQGLAGLDAARLAQGFQVSADNPLTGLEGRARLLGALGRRLCERPDLFDPLGSGVSRPGGLFDLLAARAGDAPIEAEAILRLVLEALGPIWPSRLSLGGVALGDTWRHPLIVAQDATTGFVPFHKLSQWLSYSLIEPLQEAGIALARIDGLTGLPEYRNGGLFIDMGVLAPRDPALLSQPQAASDVAIVEWRALTVALLDELAARIRITLGRDAQSLPLACVLEGGTWAAGRVIAAQKRGDGSPPLNIISDGTIF